MTQDASKIQNDTISAPGTNDTSLDFDPRMVGDIYNEFAQEVDTINRYLKSSKVKGEAQGIKDEKSKKATIIVTLENKADLIKVEEEITKQIRMERLKMTSYRVELSLIIREACTNEKLKEEVIEWD